MENNRLVSVLGAAAKHILTALRRAFVAIALTGFIVALIAGLATEIIAIVLSGGKFPPEGATHLAAAALGVAFGYAAAMTVAVAEILRGMILTIELIVKEAEKLGGEAIREAEKLGGEAFHEAGRAGRAVVGDAESIGRGASGLVGGVLGGIGNEVGRVEHGIGSIGHRHNNDSTGAQQPQATPNFPNS